MEMGFERGSEKTYMGPREDKRKLGDPENEKGDKKVRCESLVKGGEMA